MQRILTMAAMAIMLAGCCGPRQCCPPQQCGSFCPPACQGQVMMGSPAMSGQVVMPGPG